MFAVLDMRVNVNHADTLALAPLAEEAALRFAKPAVDAPATTARVTRSSAALVALAPAPVLSAAAEKQEAAEAKRAAACAKERAAAARRLKTHLAGQAAQRKQRTGLRNRWLPSHVEELLKAVREQRRKPTACQSGIPWMRIVRLARTRYPLLLEHLLCDDAKLKDCRCLRKKWAALEEKGLVA
jgi:hypothetical protein